MNSKRTMKDRLKIIAKYFYIVLFFILLCGGLAFYYASHQPGYFESKSIILIQNDKNKNINELNTFVTHLKTRNILNKVSNDLNLEYKYEQLLTMIDVKIIKNTKLIEITAKSNIPKQSKEIVDKMINVFEEEMQDFYPNENLQVIDNAIVNNQKKFINLNIYGTLGILSGLIIGVFIVLSFGSLDVNIKNHEDLKKYLKLKSLGIVPDNLIDEETSKKKRKKSIVPILSNPNSIISESYRMIRTNLDFLDLKVINFTSTTSNEGKSSTLVNVGIAFAMIGKKVLIIDCDLRKPVIHLIFEMNRSLGLTDIILYDRINEYQKMVQQFSIPNKDYKIDILSTGSKIYNPSELLNSNRFAKLIEKAKEDYDLILIDCPPISLMTDAVIVSRVTDGTVYIVEYNRVNCASIQSCIDQLNDINAFVLGGVITKVNIRSQKKLYGNKYDYYYSNYM